jgi:hypothetical protein
MAGGYPALLCRMTPTTARRAAFAIWAISLTAWLAYLALEAYFAPLTICEFATGSSLYGEAGWSLLPPGSTCTFDAGLLGTDVGPHVDGPSLDRLGIALVFVLWPLTLAWMGRSEGTARP